MSGVQIGPGATPLTRMPCPTSALASDRVKATIAPYKYPRIINYVDELPKTVNGKIRRVAIRIADEKAAEEAAKKDKLDGLV